MSEKYSVRKLPKENFPKALLEIPQPPENLWIAGELPEDKNIYLCVVGSRKHTSYGREVCERLIAGLRGYKVVIVSGLAIGIDTIAHKSAIKAGLKTMAFPGSGLSKEALFPKTNALLAEEIINSGGCVLSEFEPEFKATQWSFPLRNRLMVGISKAILIIEAEEKSGTMITARLTSEYNRDLLAVPGSIFLPTSKGTNKMIRLGATPITSEEDLIEALGFERPDKEEKQKKLFMDLSKEEKLVVDLLREPLERDELIKKMKMNISSANALLSVMEIKGLIKEELGEIHINL